MSERSTFRLPRVVAEEPVAQPAIHPHLDLLAKVPGWAVIQFPSKTSESQPQLGVMASQLPQRTRQPDALQEHPSLAYLTYFHLLQEFMALEAMAERLGKMVALAHTGEEGAVAVQVLTMSSTLELEVRVATAQSYS